MRAMLKQAETLLAAAVVGRAACDLLNKLATTTDGSG